MKRRSAGTRRPSRNGYVLIAVLWLTVLLMAVAFEVSRRARLERLATLNIVDDVVLTAALDASVERARSLLSDDRRGRRAGSAFASTGESQIDSWDGISAHPSDTVSFTNAKFTTRMSDVNAKLNINRASAREMLLFLIALGVDSPLAEQLAVAICVRREGPSENCPVVRSDVYGPAQRPALWSAARPFRSVDEIADVVEIAPELWQRVAPLLTVFGSGRINIRTASGPVLMTLPGFSEETVDAVNECLNNGGRLGSLDDLLPRLSFNAREAVLLARPILDQRISFATVEVEVRSRAWTSGGLYGESIADVKRGDGPSTPYVVRLK